MKGKTSDVSLLTSTIEHDGLGPDDVDFGFKVEGELQVDGQEGEI